MTMLSRRSFLKLSALTAASAAVAAVTSGCTIQISQPGFTMASTALQTVGPVKIQTVSTPVIAEEGAYYKISFAVQNITDKEVTVPLNAFTASYKKTNLKVKFADDKTELTLNANESANNESANFDLYIEKSSDSSIGSDLKLKFRMEGSNGYSCIAYQFDDKGGAKATIPYTEFDF